MSLMPSGTPPRLTPRFLPRLRIRRPVAPTQGAFYTGFMVDELNKQRFSPPAFAVGADFVRLEDATESYLDFDGAVGLPSKIRGSALLMASTPEFLDYGANQWLHEPSAEEDVWRDYDRQVQQARLDALQIQIDEENAKEKPDTDRLADLTEQKNDALDRLLALSANATSYLETTSQLLDERVKGIVWTLEEPNVPLRLTSAFRLGRDRAICFKYLRFAAKDEQVLGELAFMLYGDKTAYEIAVGDDGNNCEFRHYRSMTTAKRDDLLGQLKAVKAKGELSADELLFLLDLDRQEAERRRQVKERDDKKLTFADSAFIQSLHDQRDALKASKKLSDADEAEKKRLEDLLYLARQSFRLQTDAQSLLGTPVTVKIQFLRAGYILIQSGNSTFRYENKYVTSLNPPQFHFALPDKSRVRVSSDGGNFHLLWGRLKYTPCRILTAPFESHDLLVPEACTKRVVGDHPGDSGYSIDLKTLKTPTQKAPGKYHLELSLTGTLDTPEVYYIELHRPANPVTSLGIEVWNSETDKTTVGQSRVLDTLMQGDKRRSQTADVPLFLGGQNSWLGASTLPSKVTGLAADVVLFDRETNAEVYHTRQGFIDNDERQNIGRLLNALAVGATEATFSAQTLAGAECVVGVVGTEEFLNRPMTAYVTLNNLWPGDAIALLCQDAGLPTSLYAALPRGEAAHRALNWRKTPTVKPGQYPSLKAASGKTFLALALAIVESCCPGGDLWSDESGLRLTRWGARDRTGTINYGTPASGVPQASHLCLRQEADEQSIGLKFTQSLSDYITSCTCIGKLNPLTGKRYIATESYPQATDPATKDSIFAVDAPRVHVCEVDETLDSDAACLRAAREFLHITPQTPDGLPPAWTQIEVDLDPSMKCGDLVMVFGVKFIVDKVDLSSLAEEGRGQRMGVSLQLAQDLKRTPIGD